MHNNTSTQKSNWRHCAHTYMHTYIQAVHCAQLVFVPTSTSSELYATIISVNVCTRLCVLSLLGKIAILHSTRLYSKLIRFIRIYIMCILLSAISSYIALYMYILCIYVSSSSRIQNLFYTSSTKRCKKNEKKYYTLHENVSCDSYT